MTTLSLGTAGVRTSGSSRWRAGAAATFGAFLAVAGLALLLSIDAEGLRLHLKARSWPVAEARVVSVTLAQDHQSDGRAMQAEHVLHVAYEFEVDGDRVSASRASLSDRAPAPDRQLMRLYVRLNFARLTGRTVPAHYDPSDPANALLDIGFDWKPVILRLATAFAAIVFGLVILAERTRRRTGLSSVN